MSRYHLMAAMLVGFCHIALSGCAPPPAMTASQAQVPPMEPGTARVWFLRQSDPTPGNIDAAVPMVFANGASIGQSKEGTAFFHNFPPGTYRFTVQAYGTPTGQGDTLQLAPGSQTYLQVQAVPNWQLGSTAGGWSFSLQPTSPEVAQQYLPTMSYLGQR